MKKRAWLAAIAVVVSACGSTDDSKSQINPSTTSVFRGTSTTDDDPAEPDPAVDSEYSALVAEATTDLAALLGVDVSAVNQKTVEPVTWTDGSIGCPQLGVLYTQALIDGVLIILDYAGAEYVYHQADDDDPFLCQNPSEGWFFANPNS